PDAQRLPTQGGVAMRVHTVDFQQLPSAREVTKEGFLKAPGRLARAGIQPYTARELGLPGDGDRIVRLYRDPAEIFRPETLQSFENATLVNDHPEPRGTFVSADNWKRLSVGEVRDIARDGAFISGVVLVKDEAAKNLIQRGKAALSAGYSF